MLSEMIHFHSFYPSLFYIENDYMYTLRLYKGENEDMVN
jgi:hypothetical protein